MKLDKVHQMVHLQSRITIRFQNVEKFEVIMIKCFPLKLWWQRMTSDVKKNPKAYETYSFHSLLAQTWSNDIKSTARALSRFLQGKMKKS